MIAVNGIYDNGTLNLEIPVPVTKAKVIVIFPEDENNQTEEKKKDSFAHYRFGVAEGKFTVPENIDSCNDEIAALFEGDL